MPYPGIVKTTLDGSTRVDFLRPAKSAKSARDAFYILFGSKTLGGAIQELEDVLYDGRHSPAGWLGGAARHYHWTQVPTSSAIPSSMRSVSDKRRLWASAARSLAQHCLSLRLEHAVHWPALWLKELETYKQFPPLQCPASYNLDQVMEQAAIERLRPPRPVA